MEGSTWSPEPFEPEDGKVDDSSSNDWKQVSFSPNEKNPLQLNENRSAMKNRKQRKQKNNAQYKEVTTNDEGSAQFHVSGYDKFWRDFGTILSTSGMFEFRVPDYHFAIISEFGIYKKILPVGTHKFNPMTDRVEIVKKFQVGEYEKGVLLRDKKIIEILEPGMHIYNKRLNEKIELVKGSIVRENSIGIFTENGKYVGVLEPGVHYINPFAHENLLIVNATIIDETQKGIELENGPLTIVEEGHEGLKLVNGILVEKLKPGIYFENHYLNEKILVVNLQIQTKELKEQTIITSDTVTIQIKSILVYQIVDSFKATCLVTDVDFSIREAIKVASQQVLSEYSLDECMGKKKLLSSLIKESVKLNCEKFGVEIDRIDIRDILITDADVSESLAAAAIARRNAESKLINAEAEVKSAELMRRAADELGTAIHIREMETMLQMAKNPNVKVHLILNQNMGKLVEEKITKEIIKQNAHDN